MTFTQEEKEFFMREALLEAQKAADNDEVPIGCVIVQLPREKAPSGLWERIPGAELSIVGRGFNRRELDGMATHHAEISAIERANVSLGNWRLTDCALFVTIEPCLMCAGAIGLARLAEVYYGAANPKFGAVESLYQVLQDKRLNHRVLVEAGVLEADCAELMQNFFRGRRA
jgi:tRNA(adenine34) deaminase